MLKEVKQHKQEKAAREAQAKRAKLQEQLKAVIDSGPIRTSSAALKQKQMVDLYKFVSQLRLSNLKLYTGAIDWDASSSPARWGPKMRVDFKMQEGGTRAIPVRNRASPLQNFPKVLRISKQPFAVGGMRLAYYAVSDKGHRYVAKRRLVEAPDPQQDIDIFQKDLETYREAARLAVLFNKRCKGANIGAKVHYGPVLMDITAEASPGEEILEEISGATSEDDAKPTVLLLEEYLEGKFIKWNNDRGHAWRKDDAIPQAFFHFAFLQTASKASTWAKVVVDIQGVVDADKTLYRLTDPAIHCEWSEAGFGKVNRGARGIVQFLESHKCNSICRSLELPGMSSTERVLLSLCSDLFLEQDLRS